MKKPTEQRFWEKVARGGSGDCWTWLGGRNTNGYGTFYLRRDDGRSPSVVAHRFAYEQLVGRIPAGNELDHLCRNRACVNPAHLEPVSHHENMARSPHLRAMVRTRRTQTHCMRGHPFTPDNTVVNRAGRRSCRICGNLRKRAKRRGVAPIELVTEES